MRMAVESALNPLISRKEAVAIINRRAVDNAVKSGKLTPVYQGKYMFFDRAKFYEYCRVSNLNI